MSRFPNKAGDHADTDDLLRAELKAAGIPTLQEAEGKGPEFLADMLRRGSGEVKTSVLGCLHGWEFKRAWSYWIAEGPGIEVEAAERLHAEHGRTVRVAGHCGCPSPREWFKGLACGSYHVDDAAGLKALADTIKGLVERPAAATAAQPTEAMVDAAIAAHDAAMGRRRDAHRVSKAQMPNVAEFKQWQREAFGAALVAAHACTASRVVDHGAAATAAQPDPRDEQIATLKRTYNQLFEAAQEQQSDNERLRARLAIIGAAQPGVMAANPILLAVQNWDITTGRARELLECWLRGEFRPDMLPPCGDDLFDGADEPREVFAKLKAAATVAQQPPTAWANAAQFALLAEGKREWIMAWNAPGKVSGEPGDQPVALDVVTAAQPSQPELTVWFGSMPESCGRENWTVMLRRKTAPEGASAHDRHSLLSGFTVCRSEYKDRMRYEADSLRFLLGEIDKQPWILDYDADLHSGYVERKPAGTGGASHG